MSTNHGKLPVQAARSVTRANSSPGGRVSLATSGSLVGIAISAATTGNLVASLWSDPFGTSGRPWKAIVGPDEGEPEVDLGPPLLNGRGWADRARRGLTTSHQCNRSNETASDRI